MCRVSKYGNVSKERSWKALRLWDSPFGCAASEGGAPFVARRAVNLHGCALPHCAPPPAATPPDPSIAPRHRVGGGPYGPQPPTPPYVPFGIRRFMQDTQGVDALPEDS